MTFKIWLINGLKALKMMKCYRTTSFNPFDPSDSKIFKQKPFGLHFSLTAIQRLIKFFMCFDSIEIFLSTHLHWNRTISSELHTKYLLQWQPKLKWKEKDSNPYVFLLFFHRFSLFHDVFPLIGFRSGHYLRRPTKNKQVCELQC